MTHDATLAKATATPRFGYAILYVPDVPAALAFYEAAFGIQRRFLHESGDYGELETGATRLAFAFEDFVDPHRACLRNRPDAPAAAAEIGLVIDDVEAAYTRAVAAGAASHKAPERKPWGQVVGYVRDLNGFLVELCTPMP